MHASDVTSILFQNLNFRAERQKIISSNIANINTPGYKTKDLSFEQELEKIQSNKNLQLKITHSNHISVETQKSQSPVKPEIYELEGLEEQNDGNNVSLDKQISEMSKNAVLFDAISKSIKKDSTWFKMMIDSSSKT